MSIDTESTAQIISKCKQLLNAYNAGKLGFMKMPEDSSPNFSNNEQEKRFTYFTLPMSLNYQRDSYKLWEAALKTYNDPVTKVVFNIQTSARLNETELREYLLRYKLALQPNKHIATWQKLAQTISYNWETISGLLKSSNYDFLVLKDIMQKQFKTGFPYLSGPKIFNYWSFIIQKYGKVELKNSEFIDIAPDTHVTKCSVILGVITQAEVESLSKEMISAKWRKILEGTGINPIDMHPPLWFWSRNNFQFKLNQK